MKVIQTTIVFLIAVSVFLLPQPLMKAARAQAAQPEIITEAAPGVTIEKVTYYMKKWNGKENLHVEVAIKNTLKEAKRFKVKVKLFDNGQTNGALVPLKGTKKEGIKLPPAIEPGKAGKAVLPFLWQKNPTRISVSAAPF